MNKTRSSRRNFLAATGKLGVGGWMALNTPMLLAAGHSATEQHQARAALVNMSAREAATFAAVADQIIPPDDLPGAADAGVVYFIDNVLGGFMADDAVMLKQGLADLDRMAAEAFPGAPGFASLTFEQQTGLLEPIDSEPFFNTMIFLTHCGMFAMPSWGGNHERSGWALLGFSNQHAWQPPFGYYDAQALSKEKSDAS